MKGSHSMSPSKKRKKVSDAFHISPSDLPFEGSKELPVLVSSSMVVFPQTLSPLLLEGENAKALSFTEEDDRLLVILSEMPPLKNLPGEEPPCDFLLMEERAILTIGTVVRVVKTLKFPDETVRVLVRGLCRCRCANLTPEIPHRGMISPLPEIETPSLENDALARNILQKFYEVIDFSPNFPDEMKMAFAGIDGNHRLVDTIADTLNFSSAEKIVLLTQQSLNERLKFLTVILSREWDILKLGSEIQSQVNETISKNNREHFLREQLEVIKKELALPANPDVAAYRERLQKIELPPAALSAVQKELDRMGQMPPFSAEYQVSSNYIDWVLSLPWGKDTVDRLDIRLAATILDEDHFGLKEVKDRILEHLAVLQLKKDRKSPILCFVGPPGVGKTSLGQSIARAMDRHFVRISLGGVRDEAEIRGHRRTYIGALPGRIITGMKKAGSANPVFMLDELDKVGADYHGDPAAALLEVLDPAQNNAFNDHFLDLDYDLSSVFFIATANMTDTIPSALLDRMEIIRLSGYTAAEKLSIAKSFLVPRQRTANGLATQQLRFSDAALKEIIEGYTCEAGVRNLERVIGSVCRKYVRRLFEPEDPLNPLKSILGVKDIKKILGARKFLQDEALKVPEIGVAMGMAWTAAGGCILPVEVSMMPGKGELKLTGSLGEVMKESALTAFSFIRSKADELNIDSERFKDSDFHIHVPDGSTPKDGPSAGITLTAALVSLLTARKVDSAYAMTGELTLRGKVTAIGGVKEKCMAALRAGIHQIILPEQNRKDLEEISPEIQKQITFHFVSEAKEALKLLLLKS